MNILALDLGNKTGWAYNKGDDFKAGTWTLGTTKEIKVWGKVRLTRRNDPRVSRLCDKILALGQFDVLIYEDVEFHTYRLQQQFWSALRSAVWLCGLASHFECVNVQTLKAFAFSGGASKATMSAALQAQHPELWRAEYDDNSIDAIWLHLWAQKNLTRLKTSTTVKQ